MIKLVCPECRRENEPARIYCHDCGARLDRSPLAKVEPKQEDSGAAHKRLRSMFDPQRDRFRRVFLTVSKMILGACATAALIQMLLPPDVPPRSKSLSLPPQINLDLENASMGRSAAPLSYTEAQVNAYLGNSLRSKHASLSKYLEFERALVGFDENTVRLTVERSLFGFSLYTGTAHEVSVQNGTISTVCKAGSIGRLAIHPKIMQFAGILFSDVGSALASERKTLAKMAAIELHPQTVMIAPKA